MHFMASAQLGGRVVRMAMHYVLGGVCCDKPLCHGPGTKSQMAATTSLQPPAMDSGSHDPPATLPSVNLSSAKAAFASRSVAGP